MDILTTKAALRAVLAPARASRRIALVPTMGNLHDGHLALVDRARELADMVVVSIFVNPLQFGAGEDFEQYPRTADEDQRLLRERGVACLFHPQVDEMYARPMHSATRVSVPQLSDLLCGAARPGHFDGVTTVVCKLLNIVQPDVAVFGRKDYQQLQLIRHMVDDLALPVTIEGVDTLRAADGLALSSRNQYLTRAERLQAPLLQQVLRAVLAALQRGDRDFDTLQTDGVRALRDAGFTPDYLAILRPGLEAPAADDNDFVVLVAARLGKTRLIDNLTT